MKLANVEGGGFFAEDVFAGGEGMDAKVGVGVGMGGDVDGVNVGVEQGFERWGNSGDGELLAVGLCAVGIAAPDGGEDGMFDRLKANGEARGGAAGTDDAPANCQAFNHGVSVAVFEGGAEVSFLVAVFHDNGGVE